MKKLMFVREVIGRIMHIMTELLLELAVALDSVLESQS